MTTVRAGKTGLFLDADRDAGAIIDHRNAFVFVDDDVDLIAAPGHCLINRVVNHFVDHVVEGGLVGAADIHAGAAAHRFQTFEHLNLIGGIGGC